MALTEASLETNFNTYIGDTSTDRITAAERLQLATEATIWLQEETGNDHMVKTYTLPYYDNVHVYKITSAVASMLEGADLRRGEQDQTISFTHKSSRELAEEIGQKATESSWAMERRDNNWYLVVNHVSKYHSTQVASFDSTTADGGTWAADTTNSDATNVTADTNEFKQGSGCINFDVTVAQSGNNRATISATTSNHDLSSFNNLGAYVFWFYVDSVTNFTSITLYWGNDSSTYWSATVTTDINANAFVAGWNRVAVLWSNATQTGTVDNTAIDYIRVDFNYGAGQGNATDWRLDDLTIVRPENLTFYYTSWYVGTDTLGTTNRVAFTATSDIPYFSGQYDQYKYAVAHKMASIAYFGPLRNPTEGNIHEGEAVKALNRVKKLIPSSVTKELKNFKVRGLNFARSGGRFNI